jgi:hypothetical protein
MRPRQVSNVSSSTPAAIRFWLDDWFIDLDPAAAALDVVGLDMADPLPLDIDELEPEDSILPSLAQPPTMSAKKITNSAFLSMGNLQ